MSIAPPLSDGTQPADLTPRQYWVAIAMVMAVAIALRCCFSLSDPPWHATVGIVWHDEGAWLHNARNRALFGQWQLDQRNPMFLAPVYTAFEYVSFRLFGVGLWQARVVSEVFGTASVLCLAAAVAQSESRRVAVAAAVLLATNYVWVMWNRVALLETLMISFMVLSAAAYVRGHSTGRWGWGVAAGAFAVLAFFVKAAAACFLVALTIEALYSLVQNRHSTRDRVPGAAALAGLAVTTALAIVWFVAPHWQEYLFYNWQMSVTRKPAYTLRAFVDRASWFPVVHDFFTRMWALLLLALAGTASAILRWRVTSPLERLSLLWIGLGSLELLIHDVGNERRLVFLIPPMVIMAVLVIVRDRRLLPPELRRVTRAQSWLAAPFVLAALYLLAGSAVRLLFLYEVRPAVRLGALVAVLLAATMYGAWPRFVARTTGPRWSQASAAVLVALLAGGDLAQFGQWLMHRTQFNYQAMVELARSLPPRTLVQGKLSNGLALESQIRPIFVGTGFGNYEDRLQRSDIRYALTYRRPRPAYEGRVMLDVLQQRPWRVVRTFRVSESTTGDDEATLIEFIPADALGTGGRPEGR